MRTSNAVGTLKDGRAQLERGPRILTLAESGGQKTTVRLFVESAVRPTVDGRSLDDMPAEVPEIFVDYLRRLNASPHPDAPVSDDAFIRATQTVATVSLGKNLVPQDFTPQEATEAL